MAALVLAASWVMPASQAAAEKSFNLLDFLRGVTSPQQRPRKVRRPSVSAEWRKIPAEELACIDRELRKQGTSARTLRRKGVSVTDARVAKLRPDCRKQVEAAAKAVPTPPAPPSASAESADTAVTASSPASGKPASPGSPPSAPGTAAAAVSAGGTAAHVVAAGNDTKPALAASPTDDAAKKAADAAAAKERLALYEVEDMVLGAKVTTDDLTSGAFQCNASEQFPGLTWCQHALRERSGRLYQSTLVSILHNADKRVAYVNRVSSPVRFGSKGSAALDAEVARLSRKYGQKPRLLRIPDKDGLPDALIAIWGALQLEPLDPDSIAMLAAGESPRKGLLVDFLGNFQRSAKRDLPVYRLAGGAGYAWSASADRKGQGHQRALIFDADLAMPPPVATVSTTVPPSSDHAAAVTPREEAAVADRPAERRATEQAATEPAATEPAATEPAATDKAEAEKATEARAAEEKAAADKLAADKLAAETLAAQRLAAERAAEQAALEKAADEKAEAVRTAQEKAASDKAAADAAQAAAERAAAEQEVAQKLAAAKAAAAKAVSEKAAVEKSAAEEIAEAKAALEKLATEKAELEKDAAEKLAAARAAAEKAATEKAAAEKALAEKIKAVEEAAAARAAAARAAAEKAAAERLAQEKAAAEKAAAEKFTAEREAAKKVAAERLAAEKAAAEKAMQERMKATRLALAKQTTAGETAAERAAAAGPRTEEKPAKFRNLYVGMSSDQFATAIRKLNLDIKMQLSSYQSGDEKDHHLLLEMMRKGSTRPVMYADAHLESPVTDKFASNYGLKVLDKDSDYTIYSGLNPPQLPKFTVRRLVFYQGFFDAAGINAEEFARLLREKYQLVGSGLREGTARDQCEQCMVGLLRTGESLFLRFGNEDDQWSLEVEKASDEFSQLFRTPKL